MRKIFLFTLFMLSLTVIAQRVNGYFGMEPLINVKHSSISETNGSANFFNEFYFNGYLGLEFIKNKKIYGLEFEENWSEKHTYSYVHTPDIPGKDVQFPTVLKHKLKLFYGKQFKINKRMAIKLLPYVGFNWQNGYQFTTLGYSYKSNWVLTYYSITKIDIVPIKELVLGFKFSTLYQVNKKISVCFQLENYLFYSISRGVQKDKVDIYKANGELFDSLISNEKIDNKLFDSILARGSISLNFNLWRDKYSK